MFAGEIPLAYRPVCLDHPAFAERKCLPVPRQFYTCRFPNGRHVDISNHCEASLRVTVLYVCSGVEMHRFGTGRLCSQSGIESRSWSPRTPLLQASSSPDRHLTSQGSNLYVNRYWDQRHVTSRYTGGDASCGCHQRIL